ncbi:MAG: bacteriohopanetetrol glucosamine biosynthesis glycosyltransferase HpnI [Terriglobia bacterium]|nr:bacteriohopanetetrol glucosamine biosynthesis glycosyltransferase HpnI [Terriglobia bacterium]
MAASILTVTTRLGLLIAILGTISSTVFLALASVAAVRFRRKASKWHVRGEAQNRDELPPVTILKPLCGTEPNLEDNLESFFRLDYPDYEIVFGCRESDDPALEAVANLRAKYPKVTARVVLSGYPVWPNAKVFSLAKMIAASSNDYFVISDSDIRVQPEFLQNVIPPLLDPCNGLVTCMYRGIPAPDFWSKLEALGMSVELPSGVITADMLEGMRFALGAIMAVRRDALEKIGGIAETKDYYSDDFVLGNLVFERSGMNVVLSHYTRVGHVLTAQTFGQTFRTQLRWMRSTRYSRPRGHLGTGLTFSTPFGILGLICAATLKMWPLAIALFAWGYLNRVIQAIVIGWGVVGDRRALAGALFYPVRDLLGFFVWCASYLGGSNFSWRGERYHFTEGGRIVPAAREMDEVLLGR